jgi:hypothetical protein
LQLELLLHHTLLCIFCQSFSCWSFKAEFSFLWSLWDGLSPFIPNFLCEHQLHFVVDENTDIGFILPYLSGYPAFTMQYCYLHSRSSCKIIAP